MIINGIETDATEFFYDGCHKIYLLTGDDEHKAEYREKLLTEYVYDESDIFTISDLPEIWDKSCSLRFIRSADLETCFVCQFEDAIFE